MPVLAGSTAGSVRRWSEHARASARGAGAVRRTAGTVLRHWGLAEHADVAELLLGELLANVVVHVGEGAPHGVTLVFRAGRVRVEVRDGSPVMPSPRASDPDAESGRGLALVAELATAWGADPIPGGGKAVWFELA